LVDKLTLWLTKQEPVRVVPIFDKIVLFLVKIIYLVSYLILRLSLRIALGKKRRDRVFDKKGLTFNYEFDVIPSLYIIKFLYSIIRSLRLANPFLLKISVPKYGYKAYCPINKNDLINMTIREDEIIEHFTPKQGDIVVDIGAHMGRYTIIASKQVGTNGKVLAIEASPSNFEILNSNIKLNQLTNIISLNHAVYSKETKIKLYLPDEKESGNTIYNTIISDRAQNEEKFVEVNANTLDYLLQSIGIKQEDVNWIKIDVEGAEFDVLKGATDILSKSKDIALLIEIHNLRDSTNLYRPIVDFLKSYNFKIEFEKSHEGGEKHIIVRKQQL
jgi:FkbM family methyltransferase